MAGEALTWPADRFYWAVLSPHQRSGRRATETQLRFLLEPLIPEPIDGVHAVFHDLGDGRVLAVGLPREALQDEAVAGAVSITPASVPSELDCDVEPSALEVLEGAAAPRSVARRRRMRRVAGAAALVGGVALVAIGVQRRAAADGAIVASLAGTRAELVRAALGSTADTSPLPPELLLAAEIRSLERTRSPASTAALPPSVGSALAAVMTSWPTDADIRVDSIHAAGGQVTVRGRAGVASEVDALARRLASAPGWRAEQPSVREVRGEASFTLRLEEAAP